MAELFDLQLFAEGKADEPAAEGEGAKETAKEPEPKYTDEDVDRIISEKFAKWQKKQEAKLTEAQKLANMTAEAAAFDAFEERFLSWIQDEQIQIKILSEQSLSANCSGNMPFPRLSAP